MADTPKVIPVEQKDSVASTEKKPETAGPVAGRSAPAAQPAGVKK